jgi:succinate dehydrogenase cytochrome b subunit
MRAMPDLTAAPRARRLFRTSIGLKLVMAATGVVLSAFVLGHMLGNLTALGGEAAMNAYAESLRKLPPALWGIRAVLLGSLVLHVWAFVALYRKNNAGRPAGYRVTTFSASSWPSRAMWWTGPLLFAFVVYHLLHMTWGTVHPDFREMEVVTDPVLGTHLRAHTYHNLVTGLRAPGVAVVYLVAMAALGFHLHHGVWSVFQTLGFSQPRRASAARRFATLFTLLVCGGFALIPLLALFGRLG